MPEFKDRFCNCGHGAEDHIYYGDGHWHCCLCLCFDFKEAGEGQSLDPHPEKNG